MVEITSLLSIYVGGELIKADNLAGWTIQNEPDQGLYIKLVDGVGITISLEELRKAVEAHI